VDRPIAALNGVREALRAAGLSFAADPADSSSSLVAVDEPVDSRVSRRRILTGPEELDGVYMTVLFAGDDNGLFDSFDKELQVARVGTGVESHSRQILLSQSIPA